MLYKRNPDKQFPFYPFHKLSVKTLETPFQRKKMMWFVVKHMICNTSKYKAAPINLTLDGAWAGRRMKMYEIVQIRCQYAKP